MREALDILLAWPAGLNVFAAFCLAVFALECFDISLPKGESLGVSGALNAAAVMLLGPLPALVSGVTGTIAALVVRRTAARAAEASAEVLAVMGGLAAGTIATLVLSVASGGRISVLLQAFVVAAAYLTVEILIVSAAANPMRARSLARNFHAALARQAPLVGAQLSACVLAVLVFPYIGLWALVLVVALLLLIRQSYAMLVDIRETYRKTVEVLVEAAEGQDGRRRGHADRTAEIAQRVAAEYGMTPSEVERIGYVALLHDIDAIRGGAPSPDAVDTNPSDVLAGIRSFEDVVRVLRVFEGSVLGEEATDAEVTSAFVVALAEEIDASTDARVRSLHSVSSLQRLSAAMPREAKARAVAAALRLGLRLPALS